MASTPTSTRCLPFHILKWFDGIEGFCHSSNTDNPVFHFSILVCGAAILGITRVIKVLEYQFLDPQKKTLTDIG